MENYFNALNSVDVSKFIEKKNGLSYLSWANAWKEIKKRHPNAFYTIYENENGMFYHSDGRTCWVKTGVTVEGIEHIEYLPVMDYRNKSIPLDAVTSMDVNKAIQRSLTKACARHGLGLYVYAGEDLPDVECVTVEDNTTQEETPTEPINLLLAIEETKSRNALNVLFKKHQAQIHADNQLMDAVTKKIKFFKGAAA